MNKFTEFENAQTNIMELDFNGKDIFSVEMIEQFKLRNSFGLNPSTQIHRIFQKDFYDADVHDGYLTLPIANSNVWKDPLENPLESVTGIDPVTGDLIDYGSLVRSFYALCWTSRASASDNDWISFSHGKNTVRISTTVGKLLDRLIKSTGATDRLYMHRTWLVKVEYKDPVLISAMKNPAVVIGCMDSTGAKLAASAAIVRTDFSIEDEVRLLFDSSIKPDFPGVKYCTNPLLIRIPFDWTGFVDLEVPCP